MDDLISREAAIEAAKVPDGECSNREERYGIIYAMVEARKRIREIPSVPAVPLVHGKWVMTNGMKPPEYHHHHQCSVCAFYAPMRPPYGSREALSPYCPACGAKMNLEEQNA